jgi:hypothetical protein
MIGPPVWGLVLRAEPGEVRTILELKTSMIIGEHEFPGDSISLLAGDLMDVS